MPRIALISDIHANLHALRAVMGEIESAGVDEVVCLGDIVGYGPHPAECLALVRAAGARCVLGNHDFYTVEAVRDPSFLPRSAEARANPVWAGIAHAARELDAEQTDWLASLPRILDLGDALATHASLAGAPGWPYLLTQDDAGPSFDVLERIKVPVVFAGHTHRQEWFSDPPSESGGPSAQDGFPLEAETFYAVVVGSVGQPRTRDKRAAWTIWDSAAGMFEFRRTPYPAGLTIRAIYDAGLPAHSALRLK